MNKMQGKASSYAPIKEDASRVIINYGFALISGTEDATWREVVLYKKRTSSLTLQDVKDAIISDINDRTDNRILNGFPWTVLRGDHQGETVNVWLSGENQRNFSEAQRVAGMTNGQNLPLQVKVSETDDKEPIYDLFETVQEITTFYLAGVAFIDQCLKEGWAEKDSIDREPYEQALNPTNDE